MGYKKISGKPTESLERELDHTIFGGAMKLGIHSAEITQVVVITNKSADITFKNTVGDTLAQRFFFKNYDGSDLSYLFKQLVASCVKDVDELWNITDHPSEVKTLVGSSVRLEIGTNGGLAYTRIPEGFKAGRYIAKTITELREALSVDGLKLERTEIKGVFTDDTTKTSEDKPKTGTDTGEPNTRRRRSLPANLQF